MASWALLNQRQKNAAAAALSGRGPTTAAEDRHPVLPPRLRRALDHPSNLYMSALNLPLTREPPQTWGRQGALGGIIAPAALCCFDVRHSPTHPEPSPSFIPPLLTCPSSPGTATERLSPGKLKPENSPQLPNFTATHKHTLTQIKLNTQRLYRIMGALLISFIKL